MFEFTTSELHCTKYYLEDPEEGFIRCPYCKGQGSVCWQYSYPTNKYIMCYTCSGVGKIIKPILIDPYMFWI